jgi:hypothetical protein
MEIILKEELDKKGKVIAYAEGSCSLTGAPYKTAKFKLNDYEHWQDGALIQNALHYLSADDREFIQTQISPMGWSQMFG